MNYEELNNFLSGENTSLEDIIHLLNSLGKHYSIYPASVNKLGTTIFFLARSGAQKFLLVIYSDKNDSLARKFINEILDNTPLSEGLYLLRCGLSHENAVCIRELFDFTRPVLLGTENSFGFGDRLGLANPGHIRAVTGTQMKPVLAQQSIRELARTERTPEDVIDAATWAVFQEGYRDGFGADADHLKTTDDIDIMVCAGFTMFTFDPGDYVVNNVDVLTDSDLSQRIKTIRWHELNDTYNRLIARYEGRSFSVTGGFNLQPDNREILRGIVKYGNVIAHTVRLYTHLKNRYPNHPCEIELSVDETDSPTTPFEHFLIVNELTRLGIRLVSLAPRFVGNFEKGIDYRGDLERFRSEYIKHLKIAESLGPYKISLHSGSDKFSIYKIIGGFGEGSFHVKTAGTSYLEALRTIAGIDTGLFREILDFSRGRYESEKESYHVSGNIDRVPAAETLSDGQLAELFGQDDTRQVLHVAFGRVLTERNEDGGYRFKDRFLQLLNDHEDAHYENLIQHFHRHLKPLQS